MKEKKSVLIPNVRLSYPNLFEPGSFTDENSGKTKESYGVTAIIEREDQRLIDQLQDAISHAIYDKWGDKAPRKLKRPLKFGTDEDSDEYQGYYRLVTSASVKYPPALVDRRKNPLTENRGELYAGSYAHISVEFYAWEHTLQNGGKIYGVSCNLKAVMEYKDGEPFGGKQADAQEEFKNIEIEEDDEIELAGAKYSAGSEGYTNNVYQKTGDEIQNSNLLG